MMSRFRTRWSKQAARFSDWRHFLVLTPWLSSAAEPEGSSSCVEEVLLLEDEASLFIA